MIVQTGPIRTIYLVISNHKNNLSQNLIIGEEHRYLVDGNYKIIYKRVKEGILITDIFDTRQDPAKIADNNRKPGRYKPPKG